MSCVGVLEIRQKGVVQFGMLGVFWEEGRCEKGRGGGRRLNVRASGAREILLEADFFGRDSTNTPSWLAPQLGADGRCASSRDP